MSLLGDNGVGCGRRRISQLSNDEWRAALQQQILEKQRHKSVDDGDQRHQRRQSHAVQQQEEQMSMKMPATDEPPNQQHYGYDQPCVSEPSEAIDTSWRAGRRGVQQLSQQEWRAALELQIRQKNELKNQEVHRQRQRGEDNQDVGTAAGLGLRHDGDGDHKTPEPAPTNSDDRISCGRGRARYTVQQSREDYLKSLQDQIDEKKRLNEEAEQKKSRRRQPCRSINQDEDQHTDPIKTPPVSIPDTGDHVKPTIESPAEDAPPICTIQQQPATIPHLEYVGLDEQNNTAPPPSALAKLVDYCEELKRQNDDVKKQLLNQQGILEGLRSSLATAGSGKPALNMDSCTTSTSSNRGSKQASDPGYIKAGVGIPIQTRPRLSRGETRIPLPPSTTFRAAGRQILNSGDKPTSCEMGKTAAFHINDSKKATPIEISLETGATPNTEEPSTPDDCKQEEISSYRINASELQTKIIHDGDDVRSITGSTQSKVGTARHTTPSSSPIAPNRDEERVESGPSLPVIDDNLNDTTMNVNHSTHTGELCGTTVSVIESPVTRLQSTLVCGSPQSATHETLKPLQPASDEPDLAGDCELRSYSLTVVDGPSTYIANEMSIADVFRGRYVKR